MDVKFSPVFTTLEEIKDVFIYDLTRSKVEVVTSDPKNSSSARWNYLAAWGYAFRQSGGSNTAALEFVKKLFANVKVMDSGARSSVNTFVERGIGDVLLAWENEAHLLAKEGNGDKFEVVTPSLSILAEPTVSVINDVVDQAGAHEMTQGLHRLPLFNESSRYRRKALLSPT